MSGLQRVEEAVWCDNFGEVHPNTLNPYAYAEEDHCRPEDHRALFMEADDRLDTVTIDIEGTFDLSIDQVWPDGAPETFTADDVMALLRERGLHNGLRDWELLTGLRVTVTWAGTQAVATT